MMGNAIDGGSDGGPPTPYLVTAERDSASVLALDLLLGFQPCRQRFTDNPVPRRPPPDNVRIQARLEFHRQMYRNWDTRIRGVPATPISSAGGSVLLRVLFSHTAS